MMSGSSKPVICSPTGTKWEAAASGRGSRLGDGVIVTLLYRTATGLRTFTKHTFHKERTQGGVPRVNSASRGGFFEGEHDAFRGRQSSDRSSRRPDFGSVLGLHVHPLGLGKGDLDGHLAARGERPAGLVAPEVVQPHLLGGSGGHGAEEQLVAVDRQLVAIH